MNQPVNVNFGNRPSPMNRFNPASRENQPKMPEQNNSAVPDSRQVSEKDNKIIVRILNKVIGFCLFMIFFGIPLYFTGLSSQGIIFEKQMYFYFWILLGLVVWAAKSVIVGEMNVKRTPLDFPIIGFWLAYLVSMIFSMDRWHSFWGTFGDPSRGLMAITSYIIAYYFILSNFNAKRLKLILAAVLSSGAILTVWTILAIFGIKFLPNNLLAYAPLSLAGSITGLAAIITSLIPLKAVSILKLTEAIQMKKAWRNFLISALLVFLALDLFLVLALYNYVPWLGFFIGISVFLIFVLAKIMRPNASWTWLPMVIFVLIMILRMTGAVSIAKVNLPIEVSLNYKTSADIAVESAKNKLLVGSGPATYGYDFSLHRPKDFNLNAFYNLRFFQGTGILAEIIPTVGVIGTIFFVILILSYIGSQFYLLYKNKEKNKLYSLGTFSAAAIIFATLLSAKADGMIFMAAVLLISLALAVLLFESENQNNNLSLSLKTSPKYALALAFVFMVISAGVAFLFVFIGKVYAADLLAGKASLSASSSSQKENKLDKSINYLGRAINLNKREAKYLVQLSQYYMVMANTEAMKDENSRDINNIKQYLNYSIAAAAQAKNLSPKDVSVVESLALIYENAGLYVPDSLKLAEENYNKSFELEPFNPVYDIKLGKIKISQASSEKNSDKKKQLVNEAKDFFQQSVDKKNNYAEGYYQLSLTQEALEQTDQAIENGLKAAQINRGNANYLLSLGRMYQERNKDGDANLAEQYYKGVIALNDKDVNGHFYLGLFYEKNKKKSEAKNEYGKVIELLKEGNNNQETISQIQKMISNIDKGIENTPQSLGLVKEVEQPAPQAAQPENQPANPPVPTIEEAQP